MISDSERREIAARLMREACVWKETFPESECDFSDAAAVMQDLCVFIGLERNALCSEVFKRLADLINLPTCKNLATHLVDELVCSACGERVDIAYLDSDDDYRVRYCPGCGAKVVE